MVTDSNKIKHVYRTVAKVIDLIEEELGELSQDQKDSVGSTLMALWSSLEDRNHPRKDGYTWKELVPDVLGVK